MDTSVSVTAAGADAETLKRDIASAFEAMERVDREMARRPGTPLWNLNEKGADKISPDLSAVLSAALAWGERSGGAFDVTVARLLDLWAVADGPHPPPPKAEIEKTVAALGWKKVRLGAGEADLGGTAVDLGGIAKGYAVDLAARALREAGVEDFIVDAGGDLFVAGDKNGKPWRVGIQDPRDPAKLFRIVTPAEGSLVTSGDYERYFLWEGRRYHHILDPRTGFPAPNCRSVTIFAPTATDADAAATTVFVLGPEAGLKFLEGQKGFAGLIIDAAGGVRETFNFSTVAPTASVSSPGGGGT